MAEQAKCGCRGERSCLVCKKNGTPPVMQLDHEFYQCARCGVLLMPGECSTGEDLATCPAPCDNVDTLTAPDHVILEHSTGTSVKFGGVSVVKKFISQKLQESLVKNIDSLPWAESVSGRRKQDYGPNVNFKRQKIKQGRFTGLPEYSRSLLASLQSLDSLADFHPVELCNLEYVPERGSAIVPHKDDQWVWGERLVTLNLLSSTTLTFSLPRQSMAVHIPLPARSLVVVSGAARHDWLHSISRDKIIARRIALTLRELGRDFLKGGTEEAIGQQLAQVSLTFTGHPTNITNQYNH